MWPGNKRGNPLTNRGPYTPLPVIRQDKTDLEKVTELNLTLADLTDVTGLGKLSQLKTLYLYSNNLTHVKGLEKLMQLKVLALNNNRLTEVKGLEKLTKLKELSLHSNYDLTKAQITELQKALPKCKITHDAKK
jgi:Leucine-rich repeat (LRR) protein|tara:strand:- start:283 stop:684 length:402 start_codon:yes stop_codon:yes gene_type:complete